MKRAHIGSRLRKSEQATPEALGDHQAMAFEVNFTADSVIAGGAGLKELVGIELMVRRGLEVASGGEIGDSALIETRAAAWQQTVASQYQANTLGQAAATGATPGLGRSEAVPGLLEVACKHLTLRLSLDAAAAVFATGRGTSKSRAWRVVLTRINLLCLALGVVLVVTWTKGTWKIRFGEDGSSRGDRFLLTQNLTNAAMDPYAVMGFGAGWRPTARVIEEVKKRFSKGAEVVWIHGDDLTPLYAVERVPYFAVLAHPSTAGSVFSLAMAKWARDRHRTSLAWLPPWTAR